MAFCTHCGAQIPDGAKFCTSCGTPVAAPQPKSFVEAPAEAGEFAAIQWDEPGSEAQQQPYAQPAPAGKKEKKKKPFIVRFLLWLILIAILAFAGYYIYDNYLYYIL
jgi:uncharacterized membrane protein YvbJ